MKTGERKGAIQLSFGMIFSVIMIIAIVAITGYVISYFVNLGKATNVGLFYDRLQDEVNVVWNSAISSKTLSFNVPSEIKSVCFGDLNARNYDSRYREEYEHLRRFSSNFEKENKNMFLYPTQEAGEFAFNKLEHVDFSDLGEEFTCFDVKNGEVKIGFEKENYDLEVRVNRV
jgi:hypothetical protein